MKQMNSNESEQFARKQLKSLNVNSNRLRVWFMVIGLGDHLKYLI